MKVTCIVIEVRCATCTRLIAESVVIDREHSYILSTFCHTCGTNPLVTLNPIIQELEEGEPTPLDKLPEYQDSRDTPPATGGNP